MNLRSLYNFYSDRMDGELLQLRMWDEREEPEKIERTRCLSTTNPT